MSSSAATDTGFSVAGDARDTAGGRLRACAIRVAVFPDSPAESCVRSVFPDSGAGAGRRATLAAAGDRSARRHGRCYDCRPDPGFRVAATPRNEGKPRISGVFFGYGGPYRLLRDDQS